MSDTSNADGTIDSTNAAVSEENRDDRIADITPLEGTAADTPDADVADSVAAEDVQPNES